ncbi:TPA: type I secretion system permease/ATPase [Salmonella enterica]|uniref:Alpha-hemolysin translocation ATP-binding protein HlyB n=2 Tax=Salmonella enterica TaxID=28901 RepID=A0A722XT23_SALER|nr:type I secretion system permease/ATPase [Salmonella enterica]EDT6406917.1 type I secretion system permease/ATPase [Salmonella enterica subsp. enterica]HBN1189997.1 type I secretion system permease/ATPase [Salmonella enterica subsp. enterica serovar Schwarzengrund]EDW1265587.1 type I secretion system permease/ATPase [Salmonella enterica subsp. enterica]EGI5220201.1 type I secretion system permease/ATPase [Salmonella enterica subsp. enterica serovar Albany]EIL0012926.1 type I secretion system
MSPSEQSLWRGFAIIARYHETAVNIASLRSRYFTDESHDLTLQFVRAVRSCGLKCRHVANLEAGCRIPLPALIEVPERGYVVVLAIRDGKWLIQGEESAEILEPLPDIRYTGFLFTRRLSLENIEREFNLRWFARAFMRYKKLLGEILLASFFIQLLALVTPLFFQVVVDKVLTHQSLTTLDVLAIGMLGVCLFDVLLGGLRNYQLAHTSQRIDVTLSSLLYRHLLALPLAYFRQRQVGVTVARVHELRTVREFLTGNALTLCLDLLFTLVFFVVMALYSIPLTLIVIVSLVPYAILSLTITPELRRRLDVQFQQGARNQAFLVESITGIEPVKAMAVENQMGRRWDEQIAAYVSGCFRTQNLGNVAGQLAQLIGKVTSVAILWYGAQQVIQGELTVGALIAFNMFAGQVNAPVLRLVQLWQDFQQVSVSVKRLGDILNVPQEKAQGSAVTLSAIKGAVRFREVSFAYQPGMAPVVNRVTLSVRPGEVIGIVGRSGSGKSTLTRLIQRLYIPTGGQIFIDGTDSANIDPRWLRQQTGVVLQETQLFNGTIRDNIALAMPDAPLDSVMAAARLAGAHDFISEFPAGYDTPVGEQGGQLSGGQKQRIGIARALMTQPRILILDEATSALDYESEEIIQRNMADICRNRTVFIIAHRLSTVRQAGRIIVMEKGEIAEQGSHHQLLQRDGIYARLHRLQSKRDDEA